MTKKVSLYGLAEEMATLESFFAETYGEETEELKELHGEVEQIITEKTDSYVFLAKRLEDEILIAKKRIEEMKNYISSRKNKIERLNQYILSFAESTQRKEFVGDIYKISVKKSSKVNVFDAKMLDLDYLRTVVEPNKAKIKETLKAGGVVSGAELVEEEKVGMTLKPVTKSKKKGTKDE